MRVRCPACRGRRFTRDVLAVRYEGHDIAQVLDMTVEEALALFAGVPAAAVRLLGVPQRLVDAVDTVVAIEHDLDLVRASDRVIDLAPAGGEVVAEGTPER